jgi:hypothetical protein
VVADVSRAFCKNGCTRVDHWYDIMETYHSIVVSEKFLHVPCVPTLTTSSPFIGF